jgi:hypothetical protein
VASLTLVVACTAADPFAGYRDPTPDEREQISAVVEEYHRLRVEAGNSGDVRVLHAAYPRLAAGEDRPRGINVEAWWVERMQAEPYRGVSYTSEGPPRVRVKDGSAVASTHGHETWRYRTGPSGAGEHLVRFELVRVGDRWTIERTDEWMLGESPPPTPRSP